MITASVTDRLSVRQSVPVAVRSVTPHHDQTTSEKLMGQGVK